MNYFIYSIGMEATWMSSCIHLAGNYIVQVINKMEFIYEIF